MVLIYADGGVRRGLLATSVTAIFMRSAARNRISFTGLGQASASTQIRMAALSQTTHQRTDKAAAGRDVKAAARRNFQLPPAREPSDDRDNRGASDGREKSDDRGRKDVHATRERR